MEDITGQFADIDVIREKVGFSDAKRLTVFGIDSILEAQQNYGILSLTLSRQMRKGQEIIPVKDFENDYASLSSPHQEADQFNICWSYFSNISVDALSYSRTNAGGMYIFTFSGKHGHTMRGAMSAQQFHALDPAVSSAIYNMDTTHSFDLFSRALDTEFLVIKNNDFVSRGQFLAVSDISITGGDEDLPPVEYVPDPHRTVLH